MLYSEGDLNPILGFCFPLFSKVLPWGISIRVENRWKLAEAKVWSFVAILRTKFLCVGMFVCLCTGIWRRPDAYALKVAASCFENGIRYSFELLSRRFNATPLFNTEEETGGN